MEVNPVTDNRSEFTTYTARTDTTDSDEVLQLARTWIRECVSHDHQNCPGESPMSRHGFLPKRLIELPLEGFDPDMVRLVVTEAKLKDFQFKRAFPKISRIPTGFQNSDKHEGQVCSLTLDRCFEMTKILTMS